LNIAIFGGSFDPVHTAHVKIVKKALTKLDISRLIVVPTFVNPLKSNYHITPQKRYKLLLSVFSNIKQVDISDFEVSQKKSVYSLDTVRHLKKQYKAQKIYFIIGADNYEQLHLWNGIDELSSLVEFVVATRNGYNIPKELKILDVDVNISSTILRSKIDYKYIPPEIENDLKEILK
jgi:nicotinate-nucleotide adenylyltransferase